MCTNLYLHSACICETSVPLSVCVCVCKHISCVLMVYLYRAQTKTTPLPPWRSHFLNLIHYDYKNNSPNCLAAIFCWLHPFLRKAPSSVVHLILIELELSFFTHLASIFVGWFCGWKRWPARRGSWSGVFAGLTRQKRVSWQVCYCLILC